MKRIINCDILRIVAFIFVISVHSLLYIDFYNEPTSGATMLFLNIMRVLLMSCVPLFIILSGYLMKQKEPTKKYYSKLKNIIITYLLCSIVCVLGLAFVNHQSIPSLGIWIKQILKFEAAPYAWYLNMYFGLYLLIPFLNILWRNLKNRQQKQTLIIILIILIVLPTLLNIFRFDSLEWWKNPTISDEYTQIVPNYWLCNAYPIIYYYLGCYLQEYKLNINKLNNILLIIFFTIIFGLFNYYRNYNILFVWSSFTQYCSFEVFIISLLIANLILHNFKFKKLENNNFISQLAKLTLGAFLTSAIFDNLLYSYFNRLFFKGISSLEQRLLYVLPTICLILIFSLLTSYIISKIQILINYGFQKLKNI